MRSWISSNRLLVEDRQGLDAGKGGLDRGIFVRRYF